MKKSEVFRLAAIAAVIAGAQSTALATNGFFAHGYGMKAQGMGGASVAMTDNAFAGANNPAAAAWAGNRMEVGLGLFMPERSNTRTGLGETKSDSNLFYVPEFGYNRAVSDKLGVGVTVYGNGGMNSDYRGGVIPANGCGAGSPASNLFCGSGRLGMDMVQLIIAPTAGYKLNANHSVGVSPLLVHQQFKAEGLDFAGGMNLPNQGYDTSNGFGMRLGYLGKLTDKVNVGASYSPKISMSRFSKYKTMFLDNGNFDIPENYTLGASFQVAPTVTVALDYQRINYAGVISVGTPSAQNGFGWKSIDVTKLGVQWQAQPKLTMRAGINVGGNPIDRNDASMNTLAPGVTTTHYTIGGTYALSNTTEVTLAYMNAPSNSVTGPTQTPGVDDTIKMNQQSLGIQFGMRF